MFPQLEKLVRRVMEYPAKLLVALRITPNILTFIGFLLSAVAAYYLFIGERVTGAIWILVSGVFDMFDGAVARVSGGGSTFGAFWDSTVDRYTEFLIFLGLLGWLMKHYGTPNFRPDVLMTVVAMVGSQLVSYTRARAEGLGLQCKVGWFARPERVIILVLGLFFNQLFWTLAFLAVVTHVTAFQRIFHVYRITRK